MCNEVTVKIKRIITYVLVGISFTSIMLATGIKEVANWWDIAKPFFVVWFIALVVALLIANINQIRRVSYPTLVCISSWAYKHRVITTKFTQNTYKLYRWKNSSYEALYDYVQDLFDLMYN
jgi:Na+/alanine symporter